MAAAAEANLAGRPGEGEAETGTRKSSIVKAPAPPAPAGLCSSLARWWRRGQLRLVGASRWASGCGVAAARWLRDSGVLAGDEAFGGAAALGRSGAL